MIPGAKNAARWWSSFVYSLSADPFRGVLEIHMEGFPPRGEVKFIAPLYGFPMFRERSSPLLWRCFSFSSLSMMHSV